jgi:S1-C subfamily serine protease
MALLSQHGEVRRGRLGITIQDLTPALARDLRLELPGGAVITHVEPGSAAARAGIAPGDVIVRANGQPIQDAGDLRNLIGLLPVGADLQIVAYRDGRERALAARVGP